MGKAQCSQISYLFKIFAKIYVFFCKCLKNLRNLQKLFDLNIHSYTLNKIQKWFLPIVRNFFLDKVYNRLRMKTHFTFDNTKILTIHCNNPWALSVDRIIPVNFSTIICIDWICVTKYVSLIEKMYPAHKYR